MTLDCSIPCGGRCCRSFPINASPEHIGERYAEAKRFLEHGDPTHAQSLDLVTIAEMVIRIDQEDDESPRYTCKHLGTDGLCGIYERRPKMCREYPYGHACDTCGASNPTFLKAEPSG